MYPLQFLDKNNILSIKASTFMNMVYKYEVPNKSFVGIIKIFTLNYFSILSSYDDMIKSSCGFYFKKYFFPKKIFLRSRF